jgi:hypothetical protein
MTKWQTAAAGVLLEWDKFVEGESDEHAMAVALTGLRDALPKAVLTRVDQVLTTREELRAERAEKNQ